jgi:tyrosinase
MVNVRVLKHALTQAFDIFVFLEPPSPAGDSWSSTSIGSVNIVRQNGREGCARCREHARIKLVVRGTVALTPTLLRKIVDGHLSSLEPHDIVQYLRDHLEWKIRKIDGQEHPGNLVPGLKVSVVSSPVKIGPDLVPAFSNKYTIHPAATAGKPGGFNYGDSA